MIKTILRVAGWLAVTILTAIVFVFTFVVVPTFFWAHEPLTLKTPQVVLIPQGAGVFDIAKLLVKSGVETDPYRPAVAVFFYEMAQ